MWKERNDYEFNRHLAVAERLEIVAMDPIFGVVANEVARIAGRYGQKTKPSATDVKGMLLFGAATVMFGNDRAAAAEVQYQWPLLRPVLGRAGIPTKAQAPDDGGWRYFRQTYLEHEALVQALRFMLREMWLEMSLRMGMFPRAMSSYDWMQLDHLATMLADATWVRPASGVGITRVGKTQRSRREVGAPRLSEDVDVSGANFGYQHTVVSARLPEPRMRLVIDLGRAAPSRDVKVGLETVLWARERLGDRLRHFAYDRALSSESDITRLVRAGILPLCKPGNVDAFDDWKKLPNQRKRERKAISFAYKFGDCFHDLCLDAGMLWDMRKRSDGLYYDKVAEHTNIRRISRGGSYEFEIDLFLHCRRGGHHTFAWGLTEPVERLGKGPLQIATHLRPLQISDWERTGPALGIRQTAESNFHFLKDYMSLGNRAGSFGALAHEIDLLLLAIAHNALVWREYCQDYAGRAVA